MNPSPLILLVDDEDVFLEMASLKLQSAGYQTVSAKGAVEAMRKLEELVPDLVLSDVFMPPGPNGFELGIAIRQNPRTQQLKIAFFTSLREPWLELPEEERTEAMACLRDVAFIDKDADIESLDQAVARIIRTEAGDA